MSVSVLIVDDDPRIGTALCVRLQHAGFTVHLACDGASGVEAAKSFHPDVIVLDIRMPDMDGFETCERIRASLGDVRPAVIFLSANSQEPSRARAAEVGGNLFLAKPFQASDLIAAIQSLAPSSATNRS